MSSERLGEEVGCSLRVRKGCSISQQDVKEFCSDKVSSSFELMSQMSRVEIVVNSTLPQSHEIVDLDYKDVFVQSPHIKATLSHRSCLIDLP